MVAGASVVLELELGVDSDDAFEGLDTGTLDLVETGVAFAVVLATWLVTAAVDACVAGFGVGCPVIGFPMHFLPSADMFIPLGHLHVWEFTWTWANRHRWLQPPLLTSHGFVAETKVYKIAYMSLDHVKIEF